MSPAKKIILLFSLYILTGITILLSSKAGDSDVSTSASALSKVPIRINGWKGEDIPLNNPNDFFILTDTSSFHFLLRKYKKDDQGPEILLSALEDRMGTQRDIHDPRLCYESRGWTVLSYNSRMIGSGGHQFGEMKVISYTNKKYDINRFEIFGYLSNGKLITREIFLRLAHIRNRVMNLFGGKPGNIIYVNVSADLKYEDKDILIKELQYLMGEILFSLTSDQYP